MDDLSSNASNESNSTKIKDGYTQLAEKMDQVKNQVARMERKYDELYQAVKERDLINTANPSHEKSSEQQQQQQSQDVKTHFESLLEQSPTKQIIKSDDSAKSADSREDSSKAQQPSSPTADMDIEKMEDNPFV